MDAPLGFSRMFWIFLLFSKVFLGDIGLLWSDQGPGVSGEWSEF